MSFRDQRKLLREYARYFVNNGLRPKTWRGFAPQLISTARDFGYIHWAREIGSRIKDRDVLDVGCGMGLHSIGFVVSGVRSYTGCDPKIDLDSSVLTHLRTRDMQPADCTLRALMRRLPHVSYVRGTVANLPLAQWDIAVLHNTTEHLMDIDEVFAAVSERLKPGGLLIFRHHNYFAWNGHHLAPRDISRINTADPDQQKVIDWEHIAREPEPGSYAATHLNRIQLDHLRIVTERYYVVDEWREMVSSVSEGRMRLTPEILRRHASFSRRELETQSVYCVARRSSSSVALDSEPNGNRHLMKPREPSNPYVGSQAPAAGSG